MSKVETDYNYFTSSQTIHQNRCYLYGALVTPMEDQRSHIDIYDGTNTTENKAMRIRAQTEESKFIYFDKPILMQRGIYVDMNDKTDSYVIFWEPIED